MEISPRPIDNHPRSAEAAAAFGRLVRTRRTHLGMTQDDLALACGVGRRFIVDLEAGKPSCHLGKALDVARALAIHLAVPHEDPGT